MREIKFRAWDGNQMRHESFCEYTSGYGCMFNQFAKPESFMQYTGLKDKSGVEIYEGDIVSDHIGIGIVRYVEKYAFYEVGYSSGRIKLFCDYSLKGERESIEVIGNIYENPELLENG